LPRCGATTVLLDGHRRWRWMLEVEEEEEQRNRVEVVHGSRYSGTVAEKRQQRLARMRQYAGR
jgi:hypothetical protein